MMKLDTYSLNARVYPSILVLLPIFLIGIYYVTNIEAYYHYLTSFVFLGLFSFVLAQIGRDNGKKKEKELFKYWGGKPTCTLLSHSDDRLDIHTKRRIHSLLEQTIPGVKIPTTTQERENKEEANAIYESCTHYLISKTRDTDKYSLLFKENVNYGFRRNLWGMKIWALIIITSCMFIHGIMATKSFSTLTTLKTMDWLLFAAFFAFILFWIFIVNRDWIKTPAIAYAERLYETLNEQI